ncbi:diacylglycerol O-acyltransferase 2-like [Amphiura filiformis]|uniref:diacylglycerol O-acyltransferase 2-like n=1 Tax=Amphiura filiformis TaxID=82378 RepID=UPI003B22828D
MNFCTEATGFSTKFPGIKPYLLGLNGFFKFPIVSDVIMLSGLCAASRESFDWILGKTGPGSAVVIVAGGGVEVLEAIPKHYALYLSRRKGFIRKALQHGAHLVPVYSFGETDVYDQHPYEEDGLIRWLQVRVNKIVGYPPAMFHGRGVFNYNAGILPYRRSIDTVVGEPIPVERNSDPSAEDINQLHEKYVKALVALFDEHKTEFGVDENQQLRII